MSQNSQLDDFMDSLDMDGVSGVSCEIIHPMVEKAFDRVYENQEQAEDQLTPIERQVCHCAAVETVNRIGSYLLEKQNGSDFAPLSPEELAAFVSMGITTSVRAGQAALLALTDAGNTPVTLKEMALARSLHAVVEFVRATMPDAAEFWAVKDARTLTESYGLY